MFDDEVMECCGTCAFSCYDRTNGYVCACEHSEYIADYVDRDHWCEEYEGRE